MGVRYIQLAINTAVLIVGFVLFFQWGDMRIADVRWHNFYWPFLGIPIIAAALYAIEANGMPWKPKAEDAALQE